MGSRKRESSWSDLPRELLESIADRLDNSLDVSRFRSVCESWRFSALPFKQPISFPLKVPHFSSSNHSQSLVLSQSTLYHLSEPSSSSSSSWLVKLREQKGQRQTHDLVNPLSPLPINPLPETFPRTIDSSRFRVSELAKAYALQFSDGSYCNYKVTLSLDFDCPVIVVVASGILSVLNHQGGQETRWKVIDDISSQMSYQDVLLHNGRFYAVDDLGRTVEVDSSSLKVSVIARPLARGSGDKKSLVVSNGDLLLVDAYVRRGQGQEEEEEEEKFRVYKLNTDERRWDAVRSLEDQVLFLGEDCSFSVSAGDLGAGCEGDCIIFRDPLFMVFTLRDRKVSSLTWRPEYAEIFHPPTSTPQKSQKHTKDVFSCLLFGSLCF